jgi:cytoskeleton protein RodZ
MAAERTPGDFGGKLRDARERRGVSLRQIASATKISISVLESLERNDISRLPGGIFSRAFVRSYAVEVGLDPETTIQEFIAQFPHDSVTAGHPTSERVEDRETLESDRRTASTFLRLVAISVPIAGMVLYFGASGRRMIRDAGARLTATAPADPMPAVPSPPPSGATPTASPAAPPSTAAPAPEVHTPPAVGESTPAAVSQADDRFSVGLAARRPCWVSATVDGQKAIDRLLQAGEQRTIEVRREIVLTAADAGAISITLNGVEARPLGKPGEVITARLNLANFRDYLQAR